MADSELGLAEAIGAVRSELERAQEAGRGADVRFGIGSVEVELAVEVSKKAGGGVSVKVLSLLSLGAKGEASQAVTNTVRVILNPIGVRGMPFEVASAQDVRPDGLTESDGATGLAGEPPSGEVRASQGVGRPGG